MLGSLSVKPAAIEYEVFKASLNETYNAYLKLVDEFYFVPKNYEGQTKQELDILQLELDNILKTLEELSLEFFNNNSSIPFKWGFEVENMSKLKSITTNIEATNININRFVDLMLKLEPSMDPIKDNNINSASVWFSKKINNWITEINGNILSNPLLLKDSVFIANYNLLNNKLGDSNQIEHAYNQLKHAYNQLKHHIKYNIGVRE
jgi:hypothetical protein